MSPGKALNANVTAATKHDNIIDHSSVPIQNFTCLKNNNISIYLPYLVLKFA